MRNLLYILFLFLFCTCKDYPDKPIDNNNSKSTTTDLIIKYQNDSVFIEYQKELVYKAFNQRLYSRNNLSEEIIYKYDSLKKSVYFFNFNQGMNKIFLEKKKSINKKLPRKEYGRSLGDSILLYGGKVIYVSKLYSIVYDTNLKEIFLPYEFIINYKENKYEDILEANYSVVDKDLIVKIRYLEDYETEKDTVFMFNLFIFGNESE